MAETIEILLEQLDSRDADINDHAREELLKLGSSALEPLMNLLESGTTYQIASAIVVLGQIADPTCIDALIQLQEHPNLIVRSNLAQALGNFDDERVRKILIEMLEHEHPIVQQWVIISLGQVGGSSVLTKLLEFMQSTESSTLCHIAIQTIGELGDSQAVPYLVPFLDNEDRHVRNHAESALAKLNAQLK